jgi:homoserine O-acetyltransferase
MGGMHTWVWGEEHPDFLDALHALGELAGPDRRQEQDDSADGNGFDQERSRMEQWRVQDATGARPDISSLCVDVHVEHARSSSRSSSDARSGQIVLFDTQVGGSLGPGMQTICSINSMPSRDYDPSPKLEGIKAPLVAINSADDQVNPPELGIMEREIKRVKRGRFILIPVSDQTRGHGTHSLPELWKEHLAALLEEAKR